MTIKLKSEIKKLVKRNFNPYETMGVLKHSSTIVKFLCWGATGFVNFEDHALVFKVRAHRHKGYVCITLDWNDTYIVTLLSTHGNVVKTLTEVYFDELVERIDDTIEKIPAYVD
jgi:hypothetical protein